MSRPRSFRHGTRLRFMPSWLVGMGGCLESADSSAQTRGIAAPSGARCGCRPTARTTVHEVVTSDPPGLAGESR